MSICDCYTFLLLVETEQVFNKHQSQLKTHVVIFFWTHLSKCSSAYYFERLKVLQSKPGPLQAKELCLLLCMCRPPDSFLELKDPSESSAQVSQGPQQFQAKIPDLHLKKENFLYLTIKILFPYSLPLHLLGLLLPSFVLVSFV